MTATFDFTACRSANGSATKMIARLRNGTIRKTPYGNNLHWHFIPLVGADMPTMRQILEDLAIQRDCMLVRGAPLPGLDLGQSHRRLIKPCPKNHDPATLDQRALAWIAIDVDDCPVPAPFGEADRLLAAGYHVRDQMLPPEFHGARCIVTPSPSTGLNGPELARLRLWFLLDRAHEPKALYDWGRGARTLHHPVDPQIYIPNQPIYTARPFFRGMNDPVPRYFRATILDGDFEAVPLKIDRFKVVVVKADRHVERVSLAVGDDWRAFLEKTLGDESLGFFIPLTAACGLAARSGATSEEVCTFVLPLLVERADPGRQNQYGEAWISKTVSRFFSRDLAVTVEARRLAAVVAQRFGFRRGK